MKMVHKPEQFSRTMYIVFVSLLLDLLAFTMILPLLPSLLEYYRINDDIGLYSWFSENIFYFQRFVGAPESFNSVLFGGFLGSMFSFLQFIASPIVGGISDVIGRKRVMVTCLIGISLSYLLWIFSSNLVIFILARFFGGISKGNVSLSMAIITDISSMKTRGKGMALVGIAFSLGFIIGPLIGAIFAVWAKQNSGQWFIVPALFAFLLSVVNLIFFTTFFTESLPQEKRSKSIKNTLQNVKALINITDLFQFRAVTSVKETNLRKLKKIGLVYFVYLFIYSGLEFTLTFLTHHVFKYTSMQQGWMFFILGLIMAVMQGAYVRKIPQNKIEITAVKGLWLIVPTFICVGLAREPIILYLGLFLYAISTAMVFPCLMTLASEYGNDKEKGTVMGIFRSLGALARALGPIVASIAFWSIGSTITYLTGALLLLWPATTLQKN